MAGNALHDAGTASGALNGHAINQATPETLAADLQRILAGPPEQAAATLRAAAEGGVVQAQLVYGQWLLDGRGVARDAAQAVQWFEHAARKGEPMALNMLGQCHAQGWGTPANPLMAAYWYRLAAQGGLDWGMYNYATALALGRGVTEDRAAALDWFHRAAALGHAKSINMIGGFHEDGWVVPKNDALALNHYLRAAEGGDFRGQFNAARLLIAQGRLDEAMRWLRAVPQTATTAFLDKAAAWLQRQATATLHEIAQAYRKHP
ncbi:tetratricopeptide repeat protein [Castellaniella sp. GW247-6E4]|uniref:tetratricopeptide repeat protein n=1 Tax=Castellaniella sp. GW247-6E4 TaxID=3140380 RepID=UPI00331553B7